MNYFDLINKCLLELNFKTCNAFTDLVSNDHKRIKNILNIINAEVCGFDNWNFLLRKVELDYPKNMGEILNTVPGRIQSLFVDEAKYTFCEDTDKFLSNGKHSNIYSVFNDKILMPISDSDKIIKINYYTNNFAQDSTGTDIPTMEAEDDISVVPFPFIEPILVYGTCMRFKGNPDYTKFSFWYGMYKDALANMRSKLTIDAHNTPTIKVSRF